MDIVAQLSRRRYAADRLPPLRCGCRDPWTCNCTTQWENRLAAVRPAAIEHIRKALAA